MTSPSRFRGIRTLEREAAARLERQGYVVLQFKDQGAPGDLFAAREDHGLFITLMRAHTPLSGIDDVMGQYGGHHPAPPDLPSSRRLPLRDLGLCRVDRTLAVLLHRAR